MIILAATTKHIHWINRKIDLLQVSDANGIAAETIDGKILGVCMMDTWKQGSVQIHIAIDNPMCFRGNFIHEVFNYIFIIADRRVAIGTVDSDNLKALRFNEKLGFKEIGRVKDGCREGVDTVLTGLRKEDCSWITHREEAA